MNTIIINEDDMDKIYNYEGDHYFENFIFNEFKIVSRIDNIKVIYKINIENNIINVNHRIIKGSKYKECKYSFIETEENIEFIESPNGELVDLYVAKLLEGRDESLSKDDNLNRIKDYYITTVSFIALLKQYIMNESYKRITVQKESKNKLDSNSKDSNKNYKNKKPVTHFLLGEIVEYVSCNRRNINYTCELWSVRGHFRHYKNGNVSWVRPYEKGKNRNTDNKKLDKIYVI